MTEPVTPESAVRRYLLWLADPSAVVDQHAVDLAGERFAQATDPIDRLHAAAALERAKAADAEAIARDFVSNARAYGEAEGIPAEAFLALGVPSDILEKAGFAVPASRGRRGPVASRRSAPTPARRAPSIPVSQIKAVVEQMPRQFTLAQLAAQAGGGSPVTVRKAVDELIAEGRAVKLGPDASHTGPGRAPTVYEQR